MSTGPKVYNAGRNAFKHGIYSQRVLPEEAEIAEQVQIGDVDGEIVLLRLRLRRALKAETDANGEPEADEIIVRDLIGTEGSKKDTKTKVRDYATIIRGLVKDIESLEKTRLALRLEQDLDPADLDPSKLTAGSPDETPPASPIR